jgi:hypothetical protein
MKRIGLLGLVLALVLTLPGCSPTAGDGTETPPNELVQPTSSPSEAVSIEGALGNAEYPIDLASSGLAQLTNGLFEEQAAPGSATMTKIQLSELVSPGDLNADGLEDAAVILVADPGGSGSFSYLAAVVNEGGTAQPLAAILLGDRIVVESIQIESGQVIVRILTRGADEPMSAEPTIELERTFRVDGDRLVEVR